MFFNSTSLREDKLFPPKATIANALSTEKEEKPHFAFQGKATTFASRNNGIPR